eukprot:NODE_31256_length_401_cov_0.824818.p2 GENE.NODE_31256_length_401_cov_0.824818~~NODE_31256_length_401_cov_0.824818.p2  ORF type:complete len:73 (-),score=23.42 NODE_31256_length_401_cov_0.824818:79-297(-)
MCIRDNMGSHPHSMGSAVHAAERISRSPECDSEKKKKKKKKKDSAAVPYKKKKMPTKKKYEYEEERQTERNT